MLDSSTIADKANEYGSIFREDLVPPLEKAVYYTELLVKYPHAPHLKSAAKRVTWYQHALLDVALVLGCVGLLLSFVGYLFCRFLLKICFRSATDKGKGNGRVRRPGLESKKKK